MTRRTSLKRSLTLISTLVLCLSAASIVAAQDQPGTQAPLLQNGGVAFTIGNPGGLNFTVTRISANQWGWTVGAGYISGSDGDVLAGFQGGVVRQIGNGRNHYRAWSFHAGYINCDDCDGNVAAGYAGAGFIYKWRFLYSQIDLNFGGWQEEWGNPQIGLQLGVSLYTFRR